MIDQLTEKDIALVNRELALIDKAANIDNMPPVVTELLLTFCPDSRFKETRSKILSSIIDDVKKVAFIQYGSCELKMRKIKEVPAYKFAKDICKGIIYATQQLQQQDTTQSFNGQSPFHFTTVGDLRTKVSADMAVTVKNERIGLLIDSQFMYRYAFDDFMRNTMRIGDEPGLEGMKFNLQEKAILGGVEEACHAFDVVIMKASGQVVNQETVGYKIGKKIDMAEHQKSPLEKNALALKRGAVEHFRLGEQMAQGRNPR